MTDDSSTYFTTIEEHFGLARGTGFFVLSPRDWALIDALKTSGIPLEAVLRGIDRAFETRRRRPEARTQLVNSLAYCTQAIAAEAQAMASAALIAKTGSRTPFSLEAVQDFVALNAGVLRDAGHGELAESLESLDLKSLYTDLEQLEARLTAIEGELIARFRATASKEALSDARSALERELRPYRGRMTADQIAMLERQFLERKLLESAGLPRLSLFYL
jgi:hypothetical protein